MGFFLIYAGIENDGEAAVPSTQYLFIGIPSLGQTLTIAVG